MIIFAMLVILFATLAIRVPYVLFWDIFFSSDTAVIGLMAQHLLKGEFSLYYWGEGYYGALDTLLLAPLFSYIGVSPTVSQILPLILFLTLLCGTFFYLKRILGHETAFFSTLLLAFASPAFQSITFSTYNYVIILNLGVLHLLLSKVLFEPVKEKKRLFLLGLVAGISWYYFRLIALFHLSLLFSWALTHFHSKDLKRHWNGIFTSDKKIILEKIIFLKGCPLPNLIRWLLTAVNLYNCLNLSIASFLWFRGDWIFTVGDKTVKLYFWPIFKSSIFMGVGVLLLFFWKRVYQRSLLLLKERTIRIFLLGFLLGYAPAIFGYFLGQKPASPGGIVPLPVIFSNLMLVASNMTANLAGNSGIVPLTIYSFFIVCASLIVILWKFVRDLRDWFSGARVPTGEFMILSLAVVTLLTGIFCNRLADVNALRYLAPLYLCVPVGIVWVCLVAKKYSPVLVGALFVLLLVHQVMANFREWEKHQPNFPPNEVAQKLITKNVKGGYAPYWTAYLVTFLSGEKVILVPSSGKERYNPYLQKVKEMENIVYIGEAEGNFIHLGGENFEVVEREIESGIPIHYLKKGYGRKQN